MKPERTWMAWALAGVALTGAIVVLVVAILVAATKSTEIREAQVNNTTLLQNTDDTLALMLDCTDPAGECYKRGQASQSSAIEDITLISIYAAACADKPAEQTTQEIEDCILAEIESADRKP